MDGPPYGYCADYWTASGGLGVEICGYHDGLRFRAREAHFADTGVVIDARMLAGRPARVLYTPEGSPHLNPYDPITVWVYDLATESVYRIHGIANSLSGANVEDVIAITRSLFEAPNPQ